MVKVDKTVHKAFVQCSDRQWAEFKAQSALRGETIQSYLGWLVHRELVKVAGERRRAEKRRAAAKKVIDAAIRGH